VFVTLILVAICVAFGAAFYDASVPSSTLPEFLLTLVVGAASFCALGLAATALIPNADAAPPVVNATVLPLLFLSDVFIPLRDGAPVIVEWIARVFPIKHFVDALLAAYFPIPGEPTFLWKDLLVVAGWGIAGVLLAVKFFTWEPKGGR
jgi:ABC-2 type transport system permease protein